MIIAKKIDIGSTFSIESFAFLMQFSLEYAMPRRDLRVRSENNRSLIDFFSKKIDPQNRDFQRPFWPLLR